MSEALSQEVGPLGIKVTIVEPGPYGTDWAGDSAVHTAPIAAYKPVRVARRAGGRARAPRDPSVTAWVILNLVDLPDPRLRLFLGKFPYRIAEKAHQERLATWKKWRAFAGQARLPARLLRVLTCCGRQHDSSRDCGPRGGNARISLWGRPDQSSGPR